MLGLRRARGLSLVVGSDRSAAWTVFGVAAARRRRSADDRLGLPAACRIAAHVAAGVASFSSSGPLDLPLPAPLTTLSRRSWHGACRSCGSRPSSTSSTSWTGSTALPPAGGRELRRHCGGGLVGRRACRWRPVRPASASCFTTLRARVFMGDSGSGFLGFLLAAAPFLAPPVTARRALLAVAIGLSSFCSIRPHAGQARVRKKEHLPRAPRTSVSAAGGARRTRRAA